MRYQIKEVNFTQAELNMLGRDGAGALEASLHNSAAQANGRIASLIAKADRENRDLTSEEARQSDQLLASRADAQAKIDALSDENTASTNIPSAGRQVPPEMPMSSGGDSFHGAPTSAASPKFFNMFPEARRQRSGFTNFGEFAKAVFTRDPRLFQNASGASEGVGADGGFYVPTQFFADIMDTSLTQEAIRPGATIIPMTSQTCAIPMFDLSNRATGIATLEGKLTGEGVTGTPQKPKVREVDLVAKKIQVLVPTTAELLMDSPQIFSTLLKQYMLDALSQTLDTWFISGTGAGVPLGILNAPALISVAKDASQTNTTITATNIANMASRLAPNSWSRATWIVSPSALAQLFTVKIVVRNAADSDNVGGFQPGFFTANPDGTYTLLGRPLIVSDRCSALGVKGDILLCDLRSYLVGIRQNAELLVDNSIGFKESEIWFRLNCRIDGQPAIQAPITPRVGSTTLSPFVTLDPRP
jgi:HK97 family phage major capsid protein